MRAFWWFEEGSIAGMGRPGFNRVRWFDLPFVEAQLMAWMGQHSSGPLSVEDFRRHVAVYAPKVFRFYGLDEKSGTEALRVFDTLPGLAEVLERLGERTGFFTKVSLSDGVLDFKTNKDRLAHEIDFLKSQGIRRVVTLTERHHNRAELEGHFALHHIAIEDLSAPRFEQVHELVEAIRLAKSADEKMVVHCLAGIGRTSTMLMSAHILMGKSLDEVLAQVTRQNPSFTFAGPQAEFVKSVAETAGRRPRRLID